MEFWIPLLGGALGAAVINGILALYKLRRDKEEEYKQWTRNEKLKTYTEFLSDLNPLSKRTVIMLGGQDKEAQHEYDQVRTKALMNMLLIANDDVMQHAVKLIELTQGFSSLSEVPLKEALEEIEKRKAEGSPTKDVVEQAIDKGQQAALALVQKLSDENLELLAAMRKDLGLDTGLRMNISVSLPQALMD